MAGTFVLKKNAAGKYHFVLKAGNGEIIATSETYNSKSAAKNGIESVQKNAPGPRSTTRPASSAPVPDGSVWSALCAGRRLVRRGPKPSP
jgi:uncharacterized protein YegP (UPF0339 family)